MSKEKSTQEYLLSNTSPKELLDCINSSFRVLVSSDEFTRLEQLERKKFVHHWMVLQEYFEDLNSTK